VRIGNDRLRFGTDGPRSDPRRMVVLAVLIVAGALLVWLHETGRVPTPFEPTYTPTRNAVSFAEQGQTYFSAGNLEEAIRVYQEAVRVDPGNARMWADLARIQTYSSALLTTADERRARLAAARESIERAVEANPDDSTTAAIRALVYDWSAAAEDPTTGASQREAYLTTAQASAARALQLEPGNVLALAFQAEVYVDQQKFTQAMAVASQAASLVAPDDPFSMDVHRVYATVLESNAQYRMAIEEYLRAAAVAPNFTYLYLLIGANYRQLRDIESALDYFDRAVRINEQLAIEDPTPYLAIGKTYMQDGEFFIAARNIERALAISPSNPDIYGRLGIVFFKSRNYEGAIVALQCAVDGCPQDVSRTLLCEYVFDCDAASEEAQSYGVEVVGLPLRDDSLEYYYTYGSVLTYFRSSADYPSACVDAERIFSVVLTTYGSDPTVADIAAASRGLCSAAGGAGSPEPGSSPAAPLTPSPTPSPTP
jgi:tetratricopeptide (TPR) repeat protein